MDAAMSERPIPTGEGLTFEKVWAMIQETDRQIKETSQEVKEAGRQIKETDRQMGGLHNSFGEMTEHLVAPGIVRRFNELGFNFRRAACCQIIFDEKGREITEVDLMMENGSCVIATEVKSKPQERHIERHIKQMKILREEMIRHNDNRKIYGALAGAIFGTREKAMAIDAGFFVLEQSGDTIKISVPEGFTPKEW